MNWLLLFIIGVCGGILGGMGMGGGTLLIPLLTLVAGVSQHIAQAVNLISFIPMAVVALFIHFKNRLVEKKDALLIIIPGILFCIVGALIAKNVEETMLKRFFGGFLILLSVFSFFIKNRKEDK